jgi:hypothetical protein
MNALLNLIQCVGIIQTNFVCLTDKNRKTGDVQATIIDLSQCQQTPCLNHYWNKWQCVQ